MNMKMMKGIGIAALVGIALIGLAGCSDDGSLVGSGDVPGIGGDGGDVPVINDPGGGDPAVQPPQEGSGGDETTAGTPAIITTQLKPWSQLWYQPWYKFSPTAGGSSQGTQPQGEQPSSGEAEPDGSPDAQEPTSVDFKTYSVKFVTGAGVDAKSDCKLSITFCTNANYNDCYSPETHDTPSENEPTFVLENIPVENDFLRIRLVPPIPKIPDTSCDSNDNWLLQSVEIKENNEVVYSNPNVDTWLEPGEYLKLGSINS